MPDATLKALLGGRVTVTDPAHGSTWTGKLVGLHDDPGVIIEEDGGFRICLPQSFTVTAAPLAEGPAHEGGCSFLVQPFGDDGSPQDRDHCRFPGCGKARPDPVVATLRDIAEHFLGGTSPLAADLSAIADRLTLAKCRRPPGGAMGIRTPDLLHAMNHSAVLPPGHTRPEQAIRTNADSLIIADQHGCRYCRPATAESRGIGHDRRTKQLITAPAVRLTR